MELGLPADRLWATVHEGDDEAAALWPEVTPIPAARVLRTGRREQLLGDGGDRPLRAVLGDLLGLRAEARGGHPGRQRGALPRDLEPRVHAVRPLGRRHADSAAEALRRHRHGTRADRRGRPGQVFQLRERSLHADPRLHRGADRTRVRVRGRDGSIVPRARRPRPCRRLPHRRRRLSLERGPGLRAAADHPPRGAPLLAPRRIRAGALRHRAGRGGRDGRRHIPSSSISGVEHRDDPAIRGGAASCSPSIVEWGFSRTSVRSSLPGKQCRAKWCSVFTTPTASHPT